MKLLPRFALISAAILVSFFIASGGASANHSWNGYHWARTANPFTLSVGDNVSSTWETHLNGAISDWNGSAVLDLAKVAGGTTARRCRATAGRIEVCNSTYGNNGWLGLAQIRLEHRGRVLAGIVNV